ncbi:mitochondrial 2-oxodicarboxylate carrier [Rhinopithecus roxellana]|uniref:mitochondrial 2-oxodicarboxylate carrier n=1 Tax=Rhinopithecus roxellana TaxID=61622 RepID=UPI0012375983|nr:mitochondrial 2-oxodicarboxylate carrier [Rhinopithecus roxellana]
MSDLGVSGTRFKDNDHESTCPHQSSTGMVQQTYSYNHFHGLCGDDLVPGADAVDAIGEYRKNLWTQGGCLGGSEREDTQFFTFEQYKKLLGYVSLSPALTFAIAGLGSGLTEAIVVNPFEVVKVGLQANRNTFAEQPSTMGYARQIIKKEGWGLQGLNKGLTATLGRHGVFNMVYFGFYYNVKNIIPVNKDPTLEFLRKFGIGLLSGTIASVINIPFDVAKSRIQGPQPVPGEIKYRTCFKTMATVYQEEGILALYKGLLPKIMRLGPGGAVMLLVYEYTYSWLQENW